MKQRYKKGPPCELFTCSESVGKYSSYSFKTCMILLTTVLQDRWLLIIFWSNNFSQDDHISRLLPLAEAMKSCLTCIHLPFRFRLHSPPKNMIWNTSLFSMWSLKIMSKMMMTKRKKQKTIIVSSESALDLSSRKKLALGVITLSMAWASYPSPWPFL